MRQTLILMAALLAGVPAVAAESHVQEAVTIYCAERFIGSSHKVAWARLEAFLRQRPLVASEIRTIPYRVIAQCGPLTHESPA